MFLLEEAEVRVEGGMKQKMYWHQGRANLRNSALGPWGGPRGEKIKATDRYLKQGTDPGDGAGGRARGSRFRAEIAPRAGVGSR